MRFSSHWLPVSLLVPLGVEADVIRLALHVPVGASIVEPASVAIEDMRDDILALLAGVLRQDIDPLHLGETDTGARIEVRPAAARSLSG